MHYWKQNCYAFTVGIIIAGFMVGPALAKGQHIKRHSSTLSYGAAYNKFVDGINMTHNDLVISVNPSPPLIVTITLHQKSIAEMRRIGNQYYKKYRALRLQCGQSTSDCRVIVEGPNTISGPTIIIDANGSRIGP